MTASPAMLLQKTVLAADLQKAAHRGNPFEDLATEKKEELKAFLKQWLAEQRK